MRRLAEWMKSIGPGRLINISLAAGIVLSLVFVHAEFTRGLNARRAEIRQAMDTQAIALDGTLAAISGRVERLREWTRRALLAPPADTPQLNAFLDGVAQAGADEVPMLDRVGPADANPLDGPVPAALLALPDRGLARHEGLSRPDRAHWRAEAATAVALAQQLALDVRTQPGLGRGYFIATSGLVAVAPWRAADNAHGLMAGIFERSAYRLSTLAANPTGRVLWTETPAPPPQGAARDEAPAQPPPTVAAPIDDQGRFLGVVAFDLDPAVLALPTANTAAGGAVLLLGSDDRLLSATGTPPADLFQQGRPTPVGLAAVMGKTAATAEHAGYLITTRPLANAPWRLVHVAPRAALTWSLVVHTAGSMAGFSSVLLAVVLLFNMVVRRMVRSQERSAAAEREARAATEQALAELRAAHDELDFLNREKTRFFSLISHDLRGPFNVLLGMTKELADYGTRMAPADVADFAASVHQSAVTAHTLLDNLLNWSRVQMSGTPFSPSVMPLGEVVAAAIHDLGPTADAKGIRILDASGDRHILADRTMVLAILRNLLANAIKFSHPNQGVQVTSRALGDRLEIAVSDRGIGMDPEQLDQLYRREAQDSRPGTLGEVGTGLGLTLVRDLVARHGGVLAIDSQPGVGTTVSFTVPLAAAPR
ncbi:MULTISPECIES: sensor histidine kinase [Nitrospirillum]|uniref:histidine kinase n=1 Tax=Nitrospirillum amazonense TaxID=28077 RepID=A0A560FIS6_9PROT|nr:ATP-binding protein [Nitrospirillum amazonense]MEC4593413.1 ATP-binding protein [Nitrospirillum amazonense]TWB21507.1 signal transduction histidine kinase [Nitrospirillum amazonense]